MVYLLLAIICSAMVNLVMRLSAGKLSGKWGMLTVNYLMCLLISAGQTGLGNLFPQMPELGETIGLGVIYGILILASFWLFQVNMKKSGVVLTATFAKLGLLVPMVVSIFLFGERPVLLQTIGFCIAVAAIVLINLEKNTSGMQFRSSLLVLLLVGGSADAMSKVYEEWGSPELSAQFMLYTFTTAFLLGVALILWERDRPGKYDVFFGILAGVPNGCSLILLLKALETVPAVIAYPTYSVATLLLVSMAGIFLFRERLTKQQWLAVVAILVAMVILNL